MKVRHPLNLNFFQKYLSKISRNRKKNLLKDLPLPKMLEIEPINACNLRCTMCHFSFMKKNKIEYIDTQLLEKLGFLKGLWIKIGSNFEPVMHPKFINIIQFLSEMDCKIDLTTNGTLLRKKMSDQIAISNIKNITVSFDSPNKQTYEKIRRGANFELVIERLKYLRDKLSKEETFFAINTVLCRSNIDELFDMIEYWEAMNFHQLRLIFMVVRSFENDLTGKNELLQESLYPIRKNAFKKLDDAAKHVINNRLKITLSSPYYNWSELRSTYPKNINGNIVKSDNLFALDYFNPGHYYQKSRRPGMRANCVSPFTFARILFNGDVQLCYQYIIGNLKESSFENIWYGEKAQGIRKTILSDNTICEHCDYFRFCLNSSNIDVNDRINYFQEDLIKESKIIWANQIF